MPSEYVAERVAYGERVKRMRQSALDKWAYTDGTVIYRDKNPEANESTQRAALGTHAWRFSDRRDALWHDCIGPSAYNKAQGEPIRV